MPDEPTPTNADDPTTEEPGTDEPDTFPRAYVEQLRAEAAENRVRAKRGQRYAEEVFRLRVAALAKLADPTDLPFNEGCWRTARPSKPPWTS